MARYSIGLQSFKSVREGGYVYVDKSDYIRLLLEGSKYYFLSRPRRFGKSLFISTLEYFFRGDRHLFSGLAIDSWDKWTWQQHPIIRLDFNGADYSGHESLTALLNYVIGRYEKEFGIPPLAGEPESPYGQFGMDDVTIRFRHLISEAAAKFGRKVVVLVDEYDKPLLDCLENPELLQTNRRILNALYSVLKSADDELEFVFLTGVTRIGHMNIFSGLNNLKDISLDRRFSAICGITQAELTANFREGLEELASRYGIDYDSVVNRLRDYYDGYHFSSELLDVYNPYSLVTAFDEGVIDDVWAYTGNSTYLFTRLANSDFDFFEIENIVADKNVLLGVDMGIDDPVTLLYQSGYLTIKAMADDKTYILGLPNHEVTVAFYSMIVPFFIGRNHSSLRKDYARIAQWMDEGKIEDFILWLKELLSKVTCDVKLLPLADRLRLESDFQFVVYSILSLSCGLENVELEDSTSNGRIDLTVETRKYVYIFEFKIGEDATPAINQINKKDYASRWAADHREIVKIGIAFSPNSRNIADYKIETKQ